MEKPSLIKVGETYLKFDWEYNSSNQELIKGIIQEQLSRVKEHTLKNREVTKISIEYDEGSLKTKVAMWATAIYMGIANYGSFRAGVRQIINDVRAFSDHIIEAIEHEPNVHQNDIIRSERRTGITGRIQQLYRRIEKLERNRARMTENQVQAELEMIKQEVANIIYILPAQDGRVFLNELGDNYNQNLPQPNERGQVYFVNRYGLKPDDSIEFLDD